MRPAILTLVFYITVATANAQQVKTLILTTFNSNVFDAQPSSITPTTVYNSDGYISPYAWTQGGSVNVSRPHLRFDLSSIPNDAIVIEATLILYHANIPLVNNGLHTGNNEFFVERIISPWSHGTVNWDNQPLVTTVNRVLVPATSTLTSNLCINVTKLVQDMVLDSINGRHGFRLRLQVEEPYRIALFGSAENLDCSRHPVLMIRYITSNITPVEEEPILVHRLPVAKVYPTPTSQELNIELVPTATNDQIQYEIVDLMGKVVDAGVLHQSDKTRLSLAGLASGEYILVIYDRQQVVQKFPIFLMK